MNSVINCLFSCCLKIQEENQDPSELQKTDFESVKEDSSSQVLQANQSLNLPEILDTTSLQPSNFLNNAQVGGNQEIGQIDLQEPPVNLLVGQNDPVNSSEPLNFSGNAQGEVNQEMDSIIGSQDKSTNLLEELNHSASSSSVLMVRPINLGDRSINHLAGGNIVSSQNHGFLSMSSYDYTEADDFEK